MYKMGCKEYELDYTKYNVAQMAMKITREGIIRI